MKDKIWFREKVEGFREKRGIRLVGKCLKCGNCCRGDIKSFAVDDKTLTIPQKEGRKDELCPAFDKEKNLCKYQGERKPGICVLWPFLPEHILPGCGFRFEKIEEKAHVEVH